AKHTDLLCCKGYKNQRAFIDVFLFEMFSQCNHGSRAASIVIRAVGDGVLSYRIEDTDVVVMSRENNKFICFRFSGDNRSNIEQRKIFVYGVGFYLKTCCVLFLNGKNFTWAVGCTSLFRNYIFT